MAKVIITCALCGLPEAHEARGLGHRCYLKATRMHALGLFPKGRRAPPGQHPERRAYWREWKRAYRQKETNHE